jgi:septal ring factor EnvC (AmiA/AmiB activator)
VKAMHDPSFTQMENMLTELIHSVGTLKAYFEEKEENQRRFEQMEKRFEQIDRRFEQIDKRFEQMDKRFDEVMEEMKEIRNDQHYMAARIFQNEMEIQKLKHAQFQR